MAKGKGGGTVGTVEALVMPVLEQLGMRLWDVRFEKEGPDWFLRIYIDRDEPLDLNACEEATRAINPVIDAADPIDQSYFMEVGSPGLGRKLTRDVHFEAMRGRRWPRISSAQRPRGKRTWRASCRARTARASRCCWTTAPRRLSRKKKRATSNCATMKTCFDA